MRYARATLGLVLLAASLHAQSAEPVATTAVTPPPFDTERGLQWSSSRAEYEAARADTRYALEQFSYQSDGLAVGAYLYRPTSPSPTPRPVIVYNRGSYVRPTGFAGEMLVMARRYAEAGFLVVAPQYRGSNGWKGRDEMGGGELADLMNVAPELRRIHGADPARVFLAGESRGGMMVYQALRDGFPARAASVWGAFTDLEALIAPGGPQATVAPQIWPDLAERRAAIIERRSAIRWAHRIKVPVLIMHGTADTDMPIDQSRRMDAELTRLGKVHRYREFEGEQHRIGGRGDDRDAETIAWYRRFGR